MFLLDEENQIVAQWVGKIDYKDVEEEVVSLLDKLGNEESESKP